MTYEAKIQLVRPRTDLDGRPIGWSPAYIQGFYDALAAAAQIGRKADAHIDMLRKMLLYVHQEGGIDGWAAVQNDRYEYAMSAARENGREEPTVEDEINGVLWMLHDAMHEEIADDEIGIGVGTHNAPDFGAKCACGTRAASACPGAWESGCDLGANGKHAQAVSEPPGLNGALGFRWERAAGVSHPQGLPKRLTDEQYNALTEDEKGMYGPI